MFLMALGAHLADVLGIDNDRFTLLPWFDLGSFAFAGLPAEGGFILLGRVGSLPGGVGVGILARISGRQGL